MSLIRILLIVFLTFNLLACGGNSTGVDPDAPPAPSSDTDNDGLSYADETEVYFTSPILADTDGDGISDGDEVNELGFNASANLYRFNPLIADLPSLAINFETVPELVLRFTDSSGTENTFSNSSGGDKIVTDTRSHTGGVSVTLGVEVGVSVGTTTASESKVSASVTGSYSTTESQTTANRETWEAVTTDSNFASRDTEGASIRIGVSIENDGNLAYSLDHITLLTSYIQSDATSKPIATLSYDNTSGGFQRTSFAPGDKSNLLLFNYDNLDLGTALEVLKDSRNMIVEPSLYELVDADGVPIAFDEGEVDAKTAEVIIDYGITRPQEIYKVSVLGSHGNGSLTADTLLGSILNVNYIDAGGLTEVRSIGGDIDSRWVVLVTHNDGFIDDTTLYDLNDTSYDISSIEIFPGDQLSVIYLTDVDGDGVGIREEILNGTDPTKADTDNDGITDDIEIRNAILVNSINLQDPNRYPAYVLSNPLLADADGDNLNDSDERDRGLDPNNADTDGDGISDFTDSFNGQLPIAANFTLTPVAKDGIKITGTAAGEAGTTITSIAIDWDFIANPGVTTSTATGSATSLSVNLSNTYPSPTDENDFTIAVTVTNNNGVMVTYIGDVKIYQELSFLEFAGDGTNNWREDLHIRELVDVNNDQMLDLVGFGGNDVQVSLWNGAGFGAKTTWLANNYGSAPAGGNYSKTEHPRFLIDYDDDGLTDIVAFGTSGVTWSKNSGTDFGTPTLIINNFGTANSWNSTRHIRVMADVDGNGTPDIVGFGENRVSTYLSGGVSNSIITAKPTASFTYGGGWRKGNHFRFVEDINNDGRADIIGFGSGAIFVSLGQSDGTFGDDLNVKGGAQSLTISNGWDPDAHLIKIADINNDNKLDIVGFGGSAVLVMVNETNAGSVAFADPVVWHSGFATNTGWSVTNNRNPRFIEDIDNDGYNDVAGFGATVTFSAINQLPQGKDEFDDQTSIITTSFDTSSNWFSGGLYNSRYVRDINNDGRADILGFGNIAAGGVITQRMPVITQPVEQ